MRFLPLHTTAMVCKMTWVVWDTTRELMCAYDMLQGPMAGQLCFWVYDMIAQLGEYWKLAKRRLCFCKLELSRILRHLK